jgi:hypothetical protein
LGGAIGAGIAERCFTLGWIERVKDSRAVHITTKGQEGLKHRFEINLS